MFEVIFDCETKKFFNDTIGYDPAKLGVSVVSLYSRTLDANLKEVEGKIESYWEAGFGKMWEIFEKADRIIGFNSTGFDVPALSPYSPLSFAGLPHFDIFTRVKDVEGKRVSLDALAKATLGKAKTDSGENAILYWEKGDAESLKKLKDYCENDVLITKELYDHALANGFLKYIDFWNETHEVILDFGYPKEDASTIQHSLF